MLLTFPREIGLRRNLCDTRNIFDDYITRINGKASVYTSLYSFERRHPTRSWKYDPDSVVMDRAWWDFDTTEEHDLEQVKQDVYTLLSKLQGDVRVVFTGRGFHVHQLFSDPVRGQAIGKHIIRYENEMAKGLVTLDGVGNPQKLTRVPDTYNVTRKKWAVNIDKDAFFSDPFGYEIPTKPEHSLLRFDPFRGEKIESDFNITRWIATHPVNEKQVINVFDGEIGTLDQVPIPPCLEKAMKQENPRHHVRVALVQHLADNLRWFASPSSLSYEEKSEISDKICAFISTLGWRDYNPSITKFQVNSIMDYEHTPSTAWFKARNICTGPCWLHDE